MSLLFDKYQISGEDLVWVSVAKIHAYLDLILIAETISRGAADESMHKVVLDFYL